MTEDAKPFHGTKSDLLQIIAPKEVHDKLHCPKMFDDLVVDLSVIIQAQATVIDPTQFTYGKLADHDLKHIKRIAIRYGVKRLDIVADTYHSHSIKGTRGCEARVLFEENEKLLDNLPAFLQNEENKTTTSSNLIIAQHGSNPLFWTCNADMVITRDSKVWTKSDGPKELVPWVNHVHIEADNRMIAPIADMLRGDIEIKTICVRTADLETLLPF